ncbi:RNA-binding protein 48 [Brienomyrus brachyistius]|uniref:RNA-binding protein 48 n=1 Tax=Brienomyrus brachyistius TaxID=42636 RepID=UPI0020B3784B|nr:RNA-binding protein 48 [Brienomyrus brachyistius]
MAVPGSSSVWSTPEVQKHHEQQSVCHTRPKYREGRRPKAVKVYTINLESRFLMVQGVPAIGVMTELVQLFALYGVIEEYRVMDEYPAEQFTEVYLIRFQKIQSARAAKRNLDERSFFGGLLHVCYAPEYETVEDTREKLLDRRRYVARFLQNKVKELDKTHENQGEKSKESTIMGQTALETQKSIEACDEGDRSDCSSFSYPLLPLPPQERFPPYSEQTLVKFAAGEDNMGSKYNFMDSSKQPPPFTVQKPCYHESTLRKRTLPAAKFIPRTTHLENRKRKAGEASKTLLLGIGSKCETLIGPKLPEPPKLDMDDKSLNVTADLIRNTMKKISSVPEQKPTEKKSAEKPRRRI